MERLEGPELSRELNAKWEFRFDPRCNKEPATGIYLERGMRPSL